MGLKEDLHLETVSALTMREMIAVQSATIVRAAVARMRAKSLGCAVIVDFRGTPIGIFTERSLLDVLVQGVCLDSCSVGDFADPDFLVVNRSDPIWRVWHAVQHDGVRFVCVTDESGKPIGVTGQRGLSEYLSEYFPRQVMVHRIGGNPWMQQREGA